jgi:hypothetical protein
LVQKLGEIKKPLASEFYDTRKLFCLPLIPQIPKTDLHNDLGNKIDQFWIQATDQIKDLEKTGKVSLIFFESVPKDGETGLKMIKQVCQQSYDIIKEKIDNGAKLIAIEDKDVLDEFIDWSICLSVIQRSKKVFAKVLEFYKNVTITKNKEMAQRIDKALKNKETGLLVMTDENRLQVQSYLPSDIQVFLIHPPALNDIMREIRDFWKNARKQRNSPQ